MAQIFISYQRNDREIAGALATALESLGWTVWWDLLMRGGSRFDRAIDEELAKAGCVIVLWSKASVQSDWVLDEANRGRKRQILIPLTIEKVDPPMSFGQIHAIDFTGWRRTPNEPAFQRLVDDLSRLLGPPPNRTEPERPLPSSFTDAYGIEFALIEPGRFTMGSADGRDAEQPMHEVDLTKPFYLGIYPVTQEQYAAVMGRNPGHFKGDARPVERVSWRDALAFVETLNGSDHRYRLPSEAEWEYACRAGTATAYSFGDDENDLDAYGWYRGNAQGQTHPVGQKRPNPRGLYDMHGNVYEWVRDRYGPYAGDTVTDPGGPDTGPHRVIRGGSWDAGAGDLRSAFRHFGDPDVRQNDLGFRLVRTVRGVE